MILQHGEPGEIYNIGGGNHLSNKELTFKILGIMNKDENSINFVNDRPGHDKRYAVDFSKMQSLGWVPSENFTEDLEKTIKWYEENETWWMPLKDKAEIIKW